MIMGVREAGSAEACRWKTVRFVSNFHMQDWLLASLLEYNIYLDGVKQKGSGAHIVFSSVPSVGGNG